MLFSLRTHLLLVLLGAALPGALLAAVLVARTSGHNRSIVERRLVDAARVDAEALDRGFDETIHALQALAQSPSLRMEQWRAFHEEAGRVAHAHRGWFAVVVAAADGRQLVNTRIPFGAPMRRVNDPESLHRLIAERRAVVGRLLIAQQSPDFRFAIRVPVERDGQLRYALTAVLEPRWLAGLITSRLPTADEFTRTIVDSGFVIAARTRAADRFVGQMVTETMRQRILDPPQAPFQQSSMEGTTVYSAISRSAYGWTTVVAVPTEVLDAPVRESAVALTASASALVLGGLVSVLVVSRRISGDLAAARAAASALASGRRPDPARARVAEARELHESLIVAARLLESRQRERDEQVQRATDAQAHAEAASRTKDQFLAALGHELRNPLAPALTALELMKVRGGDVFTRERQVLERQISHMTRLVDDLLDIARLSKGKIDLRRTRFELRAAVDRAVDMAQPLVAQRGHQLSVEVPAEGLLLFADEHRMVQVFVNLLTNAAKYTPQGGHIALSARRGGTWVGLACEDDGPGIAADLRPTIFEPFAQGPRAFDRREGGLGLGLSLARSFTELHGGTLSFEERQPHGSRFVVHLPLAGHEVAALVDDPARIAANGTPLRLLVVDDNADAREMLQAALQQAGHDVRTAANAEQALDMAGSVAADGAVLDIGLPGMDGYELARRLRRTYPRIRLVALTGYGQQTDGETARAAGFDAHCRKPVTLTALLGLLGADVCGPADT